MAKSHKAQHYVPSSYLSAWCDPLAPKHMTPYVWTFPKNGGDGKNKAPANLFTETDMYTIPLPDGGRDLRVEKGLSQLEKGLKQLRTDFIERRRQIPTARFMRLIAFIAAMHARTAAFRDFQREQWQEVLDLGKELEANMANKTPEERARAASVFVTPRQKQKSMSMSDVQGIVDMPVQSLLPKVLSSVVPILSQMVMTVYCTDTKPGFITSDNPVIWFDPEAHTRPFMFRGPGLMFRSIEITMPISPNHLIAIHHDEPISRGIKPVVYTEAWDETVAVMNRRTVLYASETVVSYSQAYDPSWRAHLEP